MTYGKCPTDGVTTNPSTEKCPKCGRKRPPVAAPSPPWPAKPSA